MSEAAFEVYVKIGLINEATQGLKSVSSDFDKLQKKAKEFESTLSKIKKVAIGGLLTGGGFAALWGFDKLIKPAKDYANQLALLNTQGLNHVQILQTIAGAKQASFSTMTMSRADALETIREAKGAFVGKDNNANLQEAIMLAPMLGRVTAVLSSFRGHDSKDESYEVARALEVTGAVTSVARSKQGIDWMLKGIETFGGKLSAKDYMLNFRQAGTGIGNYNDEFLYKYFPAVMQEFKGGSGGGGVAGTGLQSIRQALVSGVMSKRAMGYWMDLGLLSSKHIVGGAPGETRGFKKGGMKDIALFQSNPYDWFQKVLKPALISHGYKTTAQQNAEIGVLFGNRSAAREASVFTTQDKKLNRDKELIEQAQGLKAYMTLMEQDPYTKLSALSKQWTNVLMQLGTVVLPAVMTGTVFLTNSFKSLSQWIDAHPDITKSVVYSLGALTIALGAAGLGAALTGLIGMIAPLSSLTFIITSVTLAIAGLVTALTHVAGIFSASHFAQSRISEKSYGNFSQNVFSASNGFGGGLMSSLGSNLGSGAIQSIYNTIIMDHRVVAKVTTKAMSKSAGSQTSTTSFNPLQNMLTPAFGGF
jgi:hypothetical protein